jgi:hypothetical protein
MLQVDLTSIDYQKLHLQLYLAFGDATTTENELDYKLNELIFHVRPSGYIRDFHEALNEIREVLYQLGIIKYTGKYDSSIFQPFSTSMVSRIYKIAEVQDGGRIA